MATVLVVEDERKIRDLLRSYLEHDHFTVLSTWSGGEAITLAAQAGPDLVVLDLRLPDVPGEEVAREIRRASDVPILVLTAKTATDDRIHCLELGVDDYVTKPFSPRELVTRVRTVLRRTGDPGAAERVRTVGTVVLDPTRRRVVADGVDVVLTQTEFDLLAHLMSRPGRVYTRDELLASVWGYAAQASTRTVDVHVAQVRAKLGDASPIRTVRGVGYCADG